MLKKMTNSLNYIFITLTLLFTIAMPAFIFPIKLGQGSGMSNGFILICLSLFLFLVFYPKKVYTTICQIFKFNAVKALAIFILTLFLLIIIHMLLGDISFFKALTSYIFRISIVALPLFYGFFIVKNFKPTTIFKIYLFVLYFAFLFSVFEFIIFYFDFQFFIDIYNKINNLRTILNGHVTRAFLGKIPRIQGCFDEPAYFMFWVQPHIPLIYNLSLSKYKIFKNKYANFIFKKSFIVLLWFVIIGSQSPIHLIFAICITIFYILIRKKISVLKIFKYACILLILFLGLLFLLTKVNLENTCLYRIQIFIQTFSDIKMLIFAEQSLGTRIISYANMIYVFFKHPFIGCGISNFNQAITIQSMHSPLPYTYEYLNRMTSTHFIPTNANILYTMLAENGIIGAFPYYSFIFLLANIIKKYEKKTKHLIKFFFQGFFLFICIFIALNFYESLFQYFWVEFGIVLGLIYSIKRGKYENINS